MYHPDGQLARANYGGKSEEFLWDGLALIHRNDEHFINEPHVGGGNPVVSSKGTSYFNDILGTTVGFKSNGKYSAAALTAFGERLDNVDSTSPAIRSLGEGWFTGKPFVAGLGHAFLMRNYRATLGKWQTSDPLGYPDGWNQLAYCNNGVICNADILGASTVLVCDLTSERVINNVGQLTIGGNVVNQTGDQNGSHEIATSYTKTSDYKLTMYIYLAINVNGLESARWASGSIAQYNEHQGSEFDSTLTNVKEAVVAHELGHASYVLGTMRALMQTELDVLEQQWRSSGEGLDWITDAKIDALYDRVYERCVAALSNAANPSTINWFESSREWINIKDGTLDHVWKWRKE
jgi:RHS repeat-associated protein